MPAAAPCPSASSGRSALPRAGGWPSLLPSVGSWRAGMPVGQFAGSGCLACGQTDLNVSPSHRTLAPCLFRHRAVQVRLPAPAPLPQLEPAARGSPCRPVCAL